jgi:hypothetical protein
MVTLPQTFKKHKKQIVYFALVLDKLNVIEGIHSRGKHRFSLLLSVHKFEARFIGKERVKKLGKWQKNIREASSIVETFKFASLGRKSLHNI